MEWVYPNLILVVECVKVALSEAVLVCQLAVEGFSGWAYTTAEFDSHLRPVSPVALCIAFSGAVM